MSVVNNIVSKGVLLVINLIVISCVEFVNINNDIVCVFKVLKLFWMVNELYKMF